MELTNALQAARDPEEEGDYMAFEQLMAEAMSKKGKEGKDEKDKKKKKPKNELDESQDGKNHVEEPTV